MHATPSLRMSFVGRSIEEFKRLAGIVFRSEGVKGPSGPLTLHDFGSGPQSVSACKTMSDEEIGGLSRCSLEWLPNQTDGSAAPPPTRGYASFRGHISTELPKDKPEIKRTGYAAWRTLDRPGTMFGKTLWDIDMYAYLAMRIRSDGRSYFVNVQTESVEPTDLHQHRLFTKRPGEWETVYVKWNDFVRTNHGFVIEPQTELLRRKVRTIGFGLTDRVPGPFELCIERLWATNDIEGDEQASSTPGTRDAESGLKDRQGKSIRWT